MINIFRHLGGIYRGDTLARYNKKYRRRNQVPRPPPSLGLVPPGGQEMAEHVPVLNSPSIWVRVLPFFHIVLKLFCHFYICGLEVNPGQSRYEKMAEQYEKFENMYPYRIVGEGYGAFII